VYEDGSSVIDHFHLCGIHNGVDEVSNALEGAGVVQNGVQNFAIVQVVPDAIRSSEEEEIVISNLKATDLGLRDDTIVVEGLVAKSASHGEVVDGTRGDARANVAIRTEGDSIGIISLNASFFIRVFAVVGDGQILNEHIVAVGVLRDQDGLGIADPSNNEFFGFLKENAHESSGAEFEGASRFCARGGVHGSFGGFRLESILAEGFVARGDVGGLLRGVVVDFENVGVGFFEHGQYLFVLEMW